MILCFSHCSNGCTKSGSFADYLSLSLSVCVSTSSSLFLSALLSPILPFPPLFLVCLHFLSSFSSLLFLYTQFPFPFSFFPFFLIFPFFSIATFRSPPTLPIQPRPLSHSPLSLSLSLLSSSSIPVNNLDFFCLFSSPFSFSFLPLYSPSSLYVPWIGFSSLLLSSLARLPPARAHLPHRRSSPIYHLSCPLEFVQGVRVIRSFPSWPCTRSPISPARPVMAGSG